MNRRRAVVVDGWSRVYRAGTISRASLRFAARLTPTSEQSVSCVVVSTRSRPDSPAAACAPAEEAGTRTTSSARPSTARHRAGDPLPLLTSRAAPKRGFRSDTDCLLPHRDGAATGRHRGIPILCGSTPGSQGVALDAAPRNNRNLTVLLNSNQLWSARLRLPRSPDRARSPRPGHRIMVGRRRRSLAPRRRLERLRVPLPSADQPVWLGVDIGGSRAVSALIGVTDHLHV